METNDTKNIIHELLEAGVISLSLIPYWSSIVIGLKKEGTWHMCLCFMAPNMLTVKEKIPIPLINDLLDEAHEGLLFTKIDLYLG